LDSHRRYVDEQEQRKNSTEKLIFVIAASSVCFLRTDRLEIFDKFLFNEIIELLEGLAAKAISQSISIGQSKCISLSLKIKESLWRRRYFLPILNVAIRKAFPST